MITYTDSQESVAFDFLHFSFSYLHILYAPPTPICCWSLVFTQPLPPTVSALLSPQYGTHSLLAFTLVLYHIHSAIVLKPTVSSSPSGSHKWLRFGLWLTLRTVNDFICLLTYLFSFLLIHSLIMLIAFYRVVYGVELKLKLWMYWWIQIAPISMHWWVEMEPMNMYWHVFTNRCLRLCSQHHHHFPMLTTQIIGRLQWRIQKVCVFYFWNACKIWLVF